MEEVERHLIIDGYNMIHAWPELNAMLAYGTDAPSRRLCDYAKQIHDNETIAVTVVFDSKENRTQIEKPTELPSFSIVYAPAKISADGIIEQIVAHAKQPENVTVATHDHSIAQMVRSLKGFIIDAQELQAWVKRSESRQNAHIKDLKKSSLENKIDL